ncbi:hypothetical protein CVT24_011399 [Panaeolus cyanescens]|uniref:Uncharacterized protein n=1 Tax=Panaeolus cyanescens TaxID=181874 RepID=A0A409YGK4_9AGAR|nr:hypothetical protein CVT24_011399 [Panaeolus cyanescens]
MSVLTTNPHTNVTRVSSGLRYFRNHSPVRNYTDGVVSSLSTTRTPATSAGSSAISNDFDNKSRIDSPCFITNHPGQMNENAHVINAIRNSKPEAVKRRADVEAFLKRLGVVPPEFRLNTSLCNIIPLTRDLHAFFDYSGYFALTCDLKFLGDVKAAFVAFNREWQTNCDKKSSVVKEGDARQMLPGRFDSLSIQNQQKLDDLSSLIQRARYQILPIYPHHWLPKQTLLTVYDHDPVTSTMVATHYAVSTDNALRRKDPTSPEPPSPSQPAFGSFLPPQRSKPSDDVNPFLIILNAHIECRRAERDPFRPTLCPEDQALFDETIEAGNQIYFMPQYDPAKFYTGNPSHSTPPKDDNGHNEDGDVVMGEPEASEEGFLPPGTGNQGRSGGADPDKTVTQRRGGGRRRPEHARSIPGLDTIEELMVHLEEEKEESKAAAEAPVAASAGVTSRVGGPGVAGLSGDSTLCIDVDHWRKSVLSAAPMIRAASC